MARPKNFTQFALVALLGSTLAFAPAAHAAPAHEQGASHAGSSNSQHSDRTGIEYRSEADRLAFEKLGKYIHTSDDGTVSEDIPADVRKDNKDAASRIDEFVSIANEANSEGKHIPIATYGNETKVDSWGPSKRSTSAMTYLIK